MNKIVPGVLLTSIFLGLAAVSYQQFQLSEEKAQTVGIQNREINFLEENLNLQIQENAALEEENYFLDEQLKGTRDSLAKATSTMVTLRRRVADQAKTVKATKQRLADLKHRYSALQSTKNVGPQDGDRAAYIEKLKSEKRSLLQEMLGLRKQLMQESNTFNDSSEALDKSTTGSHLISAMEAEVTPLSNDYNVDLLQAKIKLNQFHLRKRKLGKPLSRIGKNADWKYTSFNFSIEHAMPEILLNQSFKAKIIDSQTGHVLSYVESNPNFPNSSLDSKGIGFEYLGKNLDLTYYNADIKKGKDYHLAFFIIDENGNEHTLPGAVFPLIKKGKRIK